MKVDIDKERLTLWVNVEEVFPVSVSADFVDIFLILQFPLCKKLELNPIAILEVAELHKREFFWMVEREKGVDLAERLLWKSEGGFREWLVRSEKGAVGKWVVMEDTGEVRFSAFKRREGDHLQKNCGVWERERIYMDKKRWDEMRWDEMRSKSTSIDFAACNVFSEP